MIGKAKPRKSDPGTIRFELGMNVPHNCIHGCDSEESAKHEISIWYVQAPEDEG
jgi:nucleoside-diphosphate kinase